MSASADNPHSAISKTLPQVERPLRLGILLVVALALLAVAIIDNWPELRDSFPSAPSVPSNPTGRH